MERTNIKITIGKHDRLIGVNTTLTQKELLDRISPGVIVNLQEHEDTRDIKSIFYIDEDSRYNQEYNQ